MDFVNEKLIHCFSRWSFLLCLLKVSLARECPWIINREMNDFRFRIWSYLIRFMYDILLADIRSGQHLCNYKPGEESQRTNLSKESLAQLLYLVENKFQARWLLNDIYMAMAIIWSKNFLACANPFTYIPLLPMVETPFLMNCSSWCHGWT